ncbi:uncharacterized protein LOC121812785 [Haplochromis burtoni]|uniref:uncharacterized protein LOC121812785 n=1 Tax=Haplochromis burtoni TaxID=8153 RepID=UPI001C2D0A1B|nr:uncharacterized protein LOC121812785 [Haplochromis burtoni]
MRIVVANIALFFFYFVPFAAPLDQEVTASPGADAILQCQGCGDVEITLLEWSKPELKSDGYVYFYRNQRLYENYQHSFFKGRVELRDPSMKDGDCSVILRNASIRDAGTYECRVTTRRSKGVQSEFKHSIKLTVKSSGFTDEDTENGGEKVREEKVRVEKDGGKSNWYLSLITGVPITFFIFAIPAGVIIYKRLKKCMKSPKKALNSRSESLPLSS